MLQELPEHMAITYQEIELIETKMDHLVTSEAINENENLQFTYI